MASIPTILIFGNAEVNGSQPPMGPLATFSFNDRKILRTVPYDPVTWGIPGVVNHLPWWDPSLSGGLGNFTLYWHQSGAGILPAPYNVNLGDNPYAGGGGNGGSMTVQLMQRAAEYWSGPPYFKMIKYALPGGMPQFKVGGDGYSGLGIVTTRSASLVSPDTLDYKFIVIDFNGDGFLAPYGDIRQASLAVAATYVNDMKALIAALRSSLNSPNAIVFIINHAPGYLAASGGAFGSLYRGLNNVVASETNDVFLIEMSADDFATPTFGQPLVSSDPQFYKVQAYYNQADRIFDLYKRRVEAPSRPTLGNKIPLIMSLSDSQGVGRLNPILQSNISSLTLSSERQNQFIMNENTGTIQKLLPGVAGNFNTIANTDFAGYLFTMSEKFGEYFPDGCLFVHCGKNGASVSDGVNAYSATTGGCFLKGKAENYEQFADLVSQARELSITQTGSLAINKTAIPTLFVIALGDNDIAAGYATAQKFKSGMRTLINNLRDDFGSVEYGIPTPVILVRPSSKPPSFGSIESRNLVRNSVNELVKEIANVGYIDTDDYDLADGVHYSSESDLYMGVAIYEKYIQMVRDVVPTL